MRLGRLFIVVLMLSVSSAQAGEEWEKRMGKAAASFNDDDRTGAAEQLRKARRLATSSSEIVRTENALGWVYFSLGDIKAARHHLQSARASAERLGDAQLKALVVNNQGIVEYVSGNYALATRHFKSDSTIDTRTAKRYLDLIAQMPEVRKVNEHIATGIKFRAERKFRQAIEEYDKALDIDRLNPRALEFKGYALFRLGKLAKAREYLLQAHGIAPSRATVVINLVKIECARNSESAAKNIVHEYESVIVANREDFVSDEELARICSGGEVMTLIERAEEK